MPGPKDDIPLDDRLPGGSRAGTPPNVPPGAPPSKGLTRRAPTRGGPVEDYRPPQDIRDHEGPSDEDIERFSSVTTTCRHCGTELMDDVDECWNCRKHPTRDDASPANPRRIVGGVALVLIIVLLYFALR